MGTMIPRGNASGLGVVDVVLSPVGVVLNTTTEQLFTVPGVQLATDVCLGVEKPTAQAGLGIVMTRVSADNQVGITFSNNTGSTITPTAAQRYRFIIARLDNTQGSFQQ